MHIKISFHFILFKIFYTFLFHLFLGDGEATFVNEGRHMQVIKNVRDYDPWVTLPCEVSNPASKPYLFLDHEDSVKSMKA